MLLAHAAAVTVALSLCSVVIGAVGPQVTINSTNPAMSFAPRGKWVRVPSVAGDPVMVCGEPDATITINLPSNASVLQWYAFKTQKAATYLVCIDCATEDDWERSFIVDAHDPLATNNTAEIWKSQPLSGNSNHTMMIRMAIDPRFGERPAFLTMDSILVTPDDVVTKLSGDKVSEPALIVGVIAGIGCVGLALGALIFYRRRRRSQRRSRPATSAWINDQTLHGQYAYSSVRRMPEVSESSVLDIYAPPPPKHDADTASHVSLSKLPVGAMAPHPPVAVLHSPSHSFQSRPPLRSTDSSHTMHASSSSHTSVLSPKVQETIARTVPSAAVVPVQSKPAFRNVQETIRYRDPFETRPPPAPTTDEYTRPWGTEETPPPPTQMTLLAAHALSQSPTAHDIPPLPYTLPPTRPSSQSTVSGKTTMSSVGDLPLPEFTSPKATDFPSPPSSARPLSSTIRPVRRPGGPRIPPNVHIRNSSMANISAIPEEAGSFEVPHRDAAALPDDSPLSPNIRSGKRPVSKQLPPTPVPSSPLSEITASLKGKAPVKWPDAIAGPSIVIPPFKFAPGARPRRRSTGSTPTSPDALTRMPTLIKWELDFVEFESTPEGTVVTVRSKTSKESTDTANSVLDLRPVVPIPAVDDSPVDVAEEDLDEGLLEDGVLTVSHSPTTPNSARRRSFMSSATYSSANRSRRSIPSDIATAVRRVLSKEMSRHVGPDYEQLP